MELNPLSFDKTLQDFLEVWPIERLDSMTIDEYADLSDHDSFCYWLEYGSKELGAIGDNPLTKFELWRPKNDKDFDWYTTDGKYAWSPMMGETREDAFSEIRKRILSIAQSSQSENWKSIDNVKFHSIAKWWKIAFLYSDKRLIPIYSKRALWAICNGLGIPYSKDTPVSNLQEHILTHKKDNQSIQDFSYGLYRKFAEKNRKPNFYIVGSKYGDEHGNDTIPKIDDFIRNSCVAIGFLDWVDFSQYMNAKKPKVDELIESEWTEIKPAKYKIKRYFNLLSQIKSGDIIAVKSHGAHNQLTIIAYAEVVERNGSVYEHNDNELGHHIHVRFNDTGFYKQLGLTYAETIHQLTKTKDKDKFFKVFGWYAAIATKSRDSENKEETDDSESDYNDKSEESVNRSPGESVQMTFLHNKIQNAFIRYLKKTFPSDSIKGEKRRIDAQRENQIEFVIYEIKACEDAYACVREGIGQLLDYHYQTNTEKIKKIIIVGPNEPDEKALSFIRSIKSILDIQFSYIAFDMHDLSSFEYE